MKKLFLTITIMAFGFITAFSQQVYIMNAVASTATGNYQVIPPKGTVGGIQIITSSAFNGSTTTVAIEASMDGTNWATVYQDDNSTAASFTLSSASSSYVLIIKAVCFNYYRIVYTKGNASTGTVTAIMTVK